MQEREARKKTGHSITKIAASVGQYIAIAELDPRYLDELERTTQSYTILPESFRKNCRSFFEGKSERWKITDVKVYTSCLYLGILAHDESGMPERCIDLIIESPIILGITFSYRKRQNNYLMACEFSSSGKEGSHNAKVVYYKDGEEEYTLTGSEPPKRKIAR